MENTLERCRNCHSPLHGEYCSHCGQREGSPDIHLSEAAGELVGDIFTKDSRLWRTLFALLFRPGFLPAEFNAGRKARYVPPFRLYLIISFLLFLLLSIGSGITVLEHPDLATGKNEQDELSSAPPSSQDQTQSRWIAGEDTANVNIQLGGAQEGSVQSPQATLSIDLADENDPAWLQHLDQRLEDNVDKLGQEPGAFIDLLLEYLPQMMFLLLPLFALLLKLCYLFTPFHYMQHLVFSFYYHSFAYLLYLLGAVAERFDLHADWTFLLALLYLPLALRRSYGSGLGGALGKSLFIFSAYSLLLLMGFATVSLVALLLI